MRKLTFVLIAALGLTLSACSSGGDKDDSGKTGAIEKVLSKPLTEDQIKKALLTIDDMPAGWSKADDDFFDEDDDEDGETESVSTNEKCQKFLDAFNAKSDVDSKQVGSGTVTFKKSEFGPFLAQSISSGKGSAAKETLDTFRDGISNCSTITETSAAGEDVKMTVNDMSFPKLGDDSVAFKVALENDFIPMEMPMVAIRSDQNLIVLLSIGIGAGIDAADLESIARKAVTRVKAAN